MNLQHFCNHVCFCFVDQRSFAFVVYDDVQYSHEYALGVLKNGPELKFQIRRFKDCFGCAVLKTEYVPRAVPEVYQSSEAGRI
jgi:hypothetical protein